MVNFSKIFFGAGLWFIGLITMYILNATVPILINTLDNTLNIGDTSLMRAFVWIGIIILYILLTLIAPIYNIIEGVKDGEQGKFSYILTGIIFWIFALGFVYVQYQYLTPLGAIIGTDALSTAIYWASTIIVWITIVMIVPLFMIIKGFEKGEAQ